MHAMHHLDCITLFHNYYHSHTCYSIKYAIKSLVLEVYLSQSHVLFYQVCYQKPRFGGIFLLTIRTV